MNIPIWTGTSKFVSGSGDTAFGFYDAQADFQIDADKVANFCARRLGYPLVDVELQSGSFYTAFEEAITTYGNELYAYKVRDNQLSLEGASTGSNLNHALITPNFEPIVRLTEQYGAEAEADAICDGQDVYIIGIMEHIEPCGIHSGDSNACLPPFSLSFLIH